MSNDTLIREVDEELRRDQMRKLWRRFGPVVIGVAVAIVLVVAGKEIWTWWQDSNSSRSSDEFYAAMEIADGTDFAAAEAALAKLAAETSGGYPILAHFRQAALLAQQGKTAEAIAAYDALATAQTNSHIRDLALVMAANLLVDGGDVAAVQQRVAGLLAPENPMHNAAREVLALTQYTSGDLNAALESFNLIIADPSAGQDLRSRIVAFAAQVAGEGGKTAEQLAAAKPVEDAVPADEAPAVDGGTELDTTPPASETPAAETPAN